MSKKKEVELDPDAEQWVAEEDARFEAEVIADQIEAEEEAEARAAEEEEEAMKRRFSDGPEGDDEHG